MTQPLPIAPAYDDYVAILDAAHRYSRGLDRQLREMFLSSFWDDATLHSPVLGATFRGQQGLGSFFDAIFAHSTYSQYQTGQHWVGSHVFEHVSPERVEASSQFVYLAGAGGAPRISSWGYYQDVFTKRRDQWRISERDIRIVSNEHEG